MTSLHGMHTEMYPLPILLQLASFILLHCITVVPGQASLCLLLLHQTASFNALRICSCIPDPTGWHPLWFPLQAVDLIDELMVRPVCIIVDDDHVKEVAIFIFHFTSLFDYIFKFVLLKNHQIIIISPRRYNILHLSQPCN